MHLKSEQLSLTYVYAYLLSKITASRLSNKHCLQPSICIEPSFVQALLSSKSAKFVICAPSEWLL